MADPKFIRTSLSLPETVLAIGQKKAARDMRTFSNYVAMLIAEDAKALNEEKAGKKEAKSR